MSERGRRRARGGSEARRELRGRPSVSQLPYITRRFPVTEVLSAEGLEIIENNAETIRRWRDENVSRGQLARFDARILDDLGLVRSDIDRVVRHLS